MKVQLLTVTVRNACFSGSTGGAGGFCAYSARTSPPVSGDPLVRVGSPANSTRLDGVVAALTPAPHLRQPPPQPRPSPRSREQTPRPRHHHHHRTGLRPTPRRHHPAATPVSP